MEGNMSNNFTIYLMLIVCVVLVTVDSIELYRISLTWNYMHNFDALVFESCLKKELLIKTVFSIFSFLSAIAAFFLTLFISVSVEYFLEKVVSSYLNFVYFIFGPYMLGFAIVGLIHWNDVTYVCDRRNFQQQFFSFSNSVSLIGCFLISLLVTLGASVYEVTMLYLDSILRRQGGSKCLRSLFWWAVLRSRPNLLRNNLNGERNNNVQENNALIP